MGVADVVVVVFATVLIAGLGWAGSSSDRAGPVRRGWRAGSSGSR
ncbi:hypothetical protein [Streptomyces sp. XD-27]|nr:hypothetical protein [Streptomyces sp. XD-27]WKX68993.1 hypothetical protein Q3Y56_02850 [Streptomyces sp. XD-27]